MERWLIMVGACLFLAAWGLPAQAEKVEKPQPAAYGSLREASGEVKEIQHARNEVTLESEGKRVVLRLHRATTIFVDGRVSTLDELKPGMEVRASYEERDGANRTQWLEATKVDRTKGEKLPEVPAQQKP